MSYFLGYGHEVWSAGGYYFWFVPLLLHASMIKFANSVQGSNGGAVLWLHIWWIPLRPFDVHWREPNQRGMDGHSWSIQSLDVVWKVEKGEDRVQHCLKLELIFRKGGLCSVDEKLKLAKSSAHFQMNSCISMAVKTFFIRDVTERSLVTQRCSTMTSSSTG
jgi:hypothetical protein